MANKISKQAGYRELGFTLIEMMIVVVIIGVLAAMTVPAFDDLIAKNRVKNATEDIYALLTQAKTEAVIRDQDLRVTINPNAWCIGFSTTAGCVCTVTDPNDGTACAVPVGAVNALRVVNGAEFNNVTLTDNSFGGATVFDHVRSTAGNGSMTITSGTWALQISIGVMGRVRICKPADQGGVKGIIGFPSCGA